MYVLRTGDGTLYCGVTTDPARRLRQHNAGTGAKYTRVRLPVTMLVCTEAGTHSDALKAEIAFKRQPRKAKLARVQNLLARIR